MADAGTIDGSKENRPHPTVAHSELLTDLERVNRALRTLSAGNQTLLRAADEQTLLHDMCKVIVELGGYRLAVVGFAEHDTEKTIRWVTSVAAVQTMLPERPSYTWADTELGGTTTGTAIRTGQPCVGRHILTDPVYDAPAYAHLREEAAQCGFASLTAFPLRIDGEVIGALTMAAAEANAFDDHEVRLLAEMAADLAYGIAHLRLRQRSREAQATIARLAYYDPLTGLPNRTRLLEQVQAAMQAAEAEHRALALLHLEIGCFAEINKVLGYRACDHLLQELGRRLANLVQPEDVLARVGEAAFALLLPRGGSDHALDVARRLALALHQPVEVDGVMLDPRAGIGIALYPGHAGEPEALLRRAHAATPDARPGHALYALYSGGQEQEFTRKLALMADLRRAIEHDELQLYCQPKIDMKSGLVCGAEALVRWRHPAHGMLPTIEFIKLAEQAGLITPLTNWMLEAAFRQSYTWRQEGLSRSLAINLSAHDLHAPGFVDRVAGLFSTWGVAPELIQFELTESALMSDPASAMDTLTRLKRLGTALYIDDFGTGYSSLSYLQQLPVDWIKIDQGFVMPMMTSDDSAAIVRSTIELGHNLNLKIVAEGVESEAVWNRLAELDCDVAQGYLISTPMPAQHFRHWEAQWTDKAPGRPFL
jgi:diguanylate cyclase